MLKKCLPLLCALALTLSGCADSRRIETASVIENVSVHQSQGQLFYTFYLLRDSDRPNAVTVPAASFEEARSLAEEQYVPHLSLAKLELLLLHRDVSPAVMKRDIDYISTQASFSPVAHVALCDQKTLSRLRRDPDAQELIERQIDLLRRDRPEVRTSYLAVLNGYAQGGQFLVPLITDDRELRVSSERIVP